MVCQYDLTDSTAQADCSYTYWYDPNSLSRLFCQPLPSRAADLLDVVMAIYAVDRWSRRDFKGANTGQRHIHVRVGVRDPGLWHEPKMVKLLQEFLYWLGEDVWSFHFVRRQTGSYSAEIDRFLFPQPFEPPVTVSLFSGGLDSLAGLATHMLNNNLGSHILVSGYTHNRLAERQTRQITLIRQSMSGTDVPNTTRTVCHVAVPFGLQQSLGQQEEKGQRTRGLVYLAQGAVAALQAGSETLFVNENGIGALNLPLDSTQLGVDNYRGVHPRSLMMAEDLFEMALGQPLRIENPFLFLTKGELCRALMPTGLADAVPFTVSCDSYPLRVPKRHQCGFCTSCILRRQSLLAAGLENFDPHAGYLCNVLADGLDVGSKRIFGLEVMREQVSKFARCLDSTDPWKSLIASFPELFRTHAELVGQKGLDAIEARDSFVKLFRTYVQEWKSLPGSS